MSVAIANYGAGNLRSVATALARLDCGSVITSDRQSILEADALIFPGQGAAGEAMSQLRSLGLDETVRDFVKTGKAFLGICLGMQLLLSHHDEDDATGLGLFAGNVPRFGTELKVPHMGWNQVWKRSDVSLLRGISDGTDFYFVHSYYATPDDPGVISGETEYGLKFCSMLAKDNVYGTQFHPEKSGEDGLRLLQNFLEVAHKC